MSQGTVSNSILVALIGILIPSLLFRLMLITDQNNDNCLQLKVSPISQVAVPQPEALLIRVKDVAPTQSVTQPIYLPIHVMSFLAL